MPIISSAFKKSWQYVSSHPYHYGSYVTFGAGLLFTMNYVRKSQYEYLRMGYAGAFAQFATEFFFHPIDVINTRTKAEVVGKVDTFSMTRRIFSKEGLYGFAHGLSATYYAALIGGMIYFTTYKYFKKLLKKENTDNDHTPKNTNINFFAYLFSSCIGEFLFMVIYYPFDLIRTRMQTRRHHNYFDIMDAFKQIFKKRTIFQGIRKLYEGGTPSFVLNMSNQCLIFSITESMRDYFKNKKKTKNVHDLNRVEYHTCSIIAGCIAGAVTNILEVITINKQVQGKRFNFKKFIKEHGFYSLRSGIMARMLINTLHTVTLFTVVDEIAKYFEVEL